MAKKSGGSNIWVGILSFLIPLVGVILGFVYKTSNPQRSKVAFIWALIGFVSNMILLNI